MGLKPSRRLCPVNKRPSTLTAACLILNFGLIVSHVDAQPSPAKRQFEVSSIRANTSGNASALNRTAEGFTATDADLGWLTELALQTRLIDWSREPELRSKRFDIIAKAEGKISGDDYREMLLTLLEDRFHLTYHRETKDMQIFALTVAKPDKGIGPKLARSEDADCPTNPDSANFCGVFPRPGMMNGQRISMARIALALSTFAGRPVLDETGLAGSYDFQLAWTFDEALSDVGADKLSSAGIPLDRSSGSFFTAVQEQLGLKLSPKKSPVETIVIDHVEMPSEN